MSPWNWTRNYVTSNQKIRNAFITPTDSICEYIRGKHRELPSTFLNNPISPVKTDSIHELAEYISTYANSLFHVLLTIFWSRLKNEWYNELLEKIEWKYDWVWYEILYYSLIRLDTIWVIHTYCCFMMCRAFFPMIFRVNQNHFSSVSFDMPGKSRGIFFWFFEFWAGGRFGIKFEPMEFELTDMLPIFADILYEIACTLSYWRYRISVFCVHILWISPIASLKY